MRLSKVSPSSPDLIGQAQYDLFLSAIGYESRARFVAQQCSPRARNRVACAFTERKVLAFGDNVAFFRGAGYTHPEVSDEDFFMWAVTLFEQVSNDQDKHIRIGIDVSSFTRFRLACLIAAILAQKANRPFVVDFTYTIAAYSKPSRSPEPIVNAGPVLPSFAGWSSSPSLPTVAVVGLGYEPDKAVGAVEYLEATLVWAFVPVGEDSRFFEQVCRANRTLLSRLPVERRFDYRVIQPFTCVTTLESLVAGLSRTARPVLLPFGPKVFALACLLVACLHRDTPVWRISSEQYGEPKDCAGSGHVVVLSGVFDPDAEDRAGE